MAGNSLVHFANRVQEIMDDDQRESGRIPRTVECELTADLGIGLRGPNSMAWLSDAES